MNEWRQIALENFITVSILLIMTLAQSFMISKFDESSISKKKNITICLLIINLPAVAVAVFIQFFNAIGIVYIAGMIVADLITFYEFIERYRGGKSE